MITDDFKILRSHGIQYVKDLTKVNLTELFRGRPVISNNLTHAERKAVIQLCPVKALSGEENLNLDLGLCVYCKECQFALPDKIKFTNDYKIATNDRDNLIIKEGIDEAVSFNIDALRPEVVKLFSKSLKLRQVSAGGDASNEMELNAAGNVNFDMGRYGIEFVASPRHADGIVITGPISENMSRALQITYDAVPQPKLVILVGTDAISGGIFTESKALNRNFLNDIKVDLYVPGNPAHPLTFINGLLKLTGRI